MTTTTRGMPGGAPGIGELAPARRLPNMSCRPDTIVAHPSNDPARQLIPAFRAVLAIPAGRRPRAASGWLRLLGLPSTGIAGGGDGRIRRLEAVADAAIALLDLPSVVPCAPGGELPDTVERCDPILAFALLCRRSGPIWLRDRPPAVEGLERGGVVTLLLAAPVRARIVAAVDAPDWRARVHERARALERAPVLGRSAVLERPRTPEAIG